MPPPITSMFSRQVKKSIDQDDFVVIDDRVMLPQEAVAKFFDMSVEDIMRAIQFLRFKDKRIQAVIWRNGRYYFPTADSMTAILEVSPYRNAGYDPNFLRMVFNETQKDLVTDKVYYEKPAVKPPHKVNPPPHTPPNYSPYKVNPPSYTSHDYFPHEVNSPSGTSLEPSTVMFLIFFLAMTICAFFGDPAKQNQQPQTKVETATTAVETPTVETKPVETKPSTPAQNYSTSNYKGRGFDSKPHYVGSDGFVAVYYGEDHVLYKNPEPPWQVPTYERDKQLWVKSDRTIEHKTKITVLNQHLEPARYNGNEGYLFVERLSDGERFYINVRNFILRPYWEKKDPIEAFKSESAARLLVEYHQKSDYWPVDRDNKKKVPPEGSILLFTDIDTSRANPIAAHNAEFNGAWFKPEDLTIIY